LSSCKGFARYSWKPAASTRRTSSCEARPVAERPTSALRCSSTSPPRGGRDHCGVRAHVLTRKRFPCRAFAMKLLAGPEHRRCGRARLLLGQQPGGRTYDDYGLREVFETRPGHRHRAATLHHRLQGRARADAHRQPTSRDIRRRVDVHASPAECSPGLTPGCRQRHSIVSRPSGVRASTSRQPSPIRECAPSSGSVGFSQIAHWSRKGLCRANRRILQTRASRWRQGSHPRRYHRWQRSDLGNARRSRRPAPLGPHCRAPRGTRPRLELLPSTVTSPSMGAGFPLTWAVSSWARRSGLGRSWS
jgi:hypothetical protein